MRSLLLLLPLLACGEPQVTDTDTDTDADTDADTDVQGLVVRVGQAQTDGSAYSGTEDWVLYAEEGLGAELCRVRFDVSLVSTSAGCSECLWAVDVLLEDPVLVVGEDCAPMGVNPDDLGPLDEQARSQGYAEEYIGHANVLMVQADPLWEAVCFATWDGTSFDYEWEQGFVDL